MEERDKLKKHILKKLSECQDVFKKMDFSPGSPPLDVKSIKTDRLKVLADWFDTFVSGPIADYINIRACMCEDFWANIKYQDNKNPEYRWLKTTEKKIREAWRNKPKLRDYNASNDDSAKEAGRQDS